MVIVWRLRRNTIRTALCWIVWYNVHNQQHTYISSFYCRSNRLGLSHWDPNAVCRGGCLELYYCNMVEWFWWDSSLILTTNWFPSVLWHCCFGHMTCKNCPWNQWRRQNFAPGGTGMWRTGSEVRGDKVIQKWKLSGRYFFQAKLNTNYFLDSGDFDGLTSSQLNSAER